MIAKVCDCESRRDSWFENHLVYCCRGKKKILLNVTLYKKINKKQTNKRPKTQCQKSPPNGSLKAKTHELWGASPPRNPPGALPLDPTRGPYAGPWTPCPDGRALRSLGFATISFFFSQQPSGISEVSASVKLHTYTSEKTLVWFQLCKSWEILKCCAHF